MREDLKLVFKNDLKQIKELKGSAKVSALKTLNEKIDVYLAAEDFAYYYPHIYTPNVLSKIANAKTGVEACNIMTTIRRAM